MALGQTVVFTLEDGTTVEVRYDGRDLRAWEAEYDKSALAERMSVGMLTWVAWNAARRQGLLNGSYDKWRDFDAVCTDIRGLPDKPPPDPTRPETGRTRKKGSGG